MLTRIFCLLFHIIVLCLSLFSEQRCAAPIPDAGEFLNGLGSALGTLTAPITNAITGKKEKDAEIEKLRKKTEELKTQSEQVSQLNQAQMAQIQQYVDRFGYNVVNRLNTNDFVTAKTHLSNNHLKSQFNSVMGSLTGDSPNMFMASSKGGNLQSLQSRQYIMDPSTAQINSPTSQVSYNTPGVNNPSMQSLMDPSAAQVNPQMMAQQMSETQVNPQMMAQQMSETQVNPQMMPPDQQQMFGMMPQQYQTQMVDSSAFPGSQGSSMQLSQPPSAGLSI